MRNIHCPKDIGFENTFNGEDCKIEQYYNGCYHCWRTAIVKVCKNCKDNTQDGWIPVSEPPKENDKYLVSVDGYWKFVDIFRYNVVKETWYALDKRDNYETDWNKCIVAWQPMPKIYRSLDNYNDDDCNSCEASQGDWLVGGICSKCGYDITPDLDWGEEAPEYCPKCNAKLR